MIVYQAERLPLSIKEVSENFYRSRGCHFLGRVPASAILESQEALPDGSFIAELYETPYDREKRRNGIGVRVVEYTIDDPAREGTSSRSQSPAVGMPCTKPCSRK